MAQEKEFPYQFRQKISIKPNQICLYNEVKVRDFDEEGFPIWRMSQAKSISEANETRPKLEKKFHNFEISKTAQRTIRSKINWLYQLSKSRYQKTFSGKEIFNFKLNFLTLTLPATQKHNTQTITQECFNQFLTEIRAKTKMENYVWRLEFQKNGNVHYHIVTDTYIDFILANRVWNRILNKLNYIDDYANKFGKMSVNQYIAHCRSNDHATHDILVQRYAKGCREKWQNPKTVDVKVCSNHKSIGMYISKYFSKTKDNNTKSNFLDNEENSFSVRLWFCSRSLSKLTSITDYTDNVDFDWFTMLGKEKEARTVFLEYSSLVFFEFKNLCNYFKNELGEYFKIFAKMHGYSSA